MRTIWMKTRPAAGHVAEGLATAILVVARDREDLDALIRLLNVSFSVVAAVLMAAIAVLVGALLRFGLRPLDEVSRQVETLDAESLDVRIRVPSPPAEIVPVIARLNALLQRLEEAFERERRLSSDVAHELRTPIAELRSIGEVAARWPGNRESVARFFADVREIALQMERIVVHLLLALATLHQSPPFQALMPQRVNSTPSRSAGVRSTA